MSAYRVELMKLEDEAQKQQDKLSSRLHKLFKGTLKPSDEKIIERLKGERYGI